MATFAQVKRDFVKGAKIKTVYNAVREEDIGIVREVEIVQSNAIAFKDKRKQSGVSWLWWKKANHYDYDGKILNCYTDEHKNTLMFSYEVVR